MAGLYSVDLEQVYKLRAEARWPRILTSDMEKDGAKMVAGFASKVHLEGHKRHTKHKMNS